MSNCALIIGIDNYLDSQINNLKFSVNDSLSFFEIAQSKFNIEQNNIFYYSNEQATYEQIFHACEQINQKIGYGDRVYVFGASHGKSMYGNPYFACYDASSKDKDNWINIPELFCKILAGKKDNKNGIIAFFDSCHSSYTFGIRGNTHVGIDLPCDYIVVFAAAGANQIAYEDSEFEHGCWSYYLLSALKGEQKSALYFGTNSITSSSLLNFLSCEVKKRVKEKMGGEQIPYRWGNEPEDIIIIDFGATKGKKMEIKNIYFGEIDADKEQETVPNEMKGNLYFDLGNVENIFLNQNQPVLLIAGNKGTGKTYLGEYLSSTYENISYYSINGIKSSDIEKITNSGISEKGKYSNAWKYLFYVLMIRELIIKKTSGFQELQKFLTSIFSEKAEMIIEDPIHYSTYIFSKKIKNGVTAPEGYEKFAENGILKIGTLVLAMEQIIKKSLTQKCYLLLDGFDNEIRGVLKQNQEMQFLDLIDACKECQKILPNYKCVLLFRLDILHKLIGLEANLNKELTGKKIELSWIGSASEYKNAPLYKFIEKRFDSNKFREGFENMSPFSEVFSGKINGNRYSKWEWVLELTTYTPRDVIAFFNECKEYASNNEDVITSEIMWAALIPYANYLWTEFSDILAGTELADKIDDLEALFQTIARTHKATSENKNFNYTEVLEITKTIEGLKEIDTKRIIELLYEAGMICIFCNGDCFWSFRENPIKFSAIDLNKATFQIHKGIWKRIRAW